MVSKKTINKNRGAFLTIMLVLAAFGVLGALYILVNMNTRTLQALYGKVPEFYYPYEILSFVLGVLFIVGTWQWKKWGFYALVVSITLSIFMQLFILKPLNIGAGIWTYISSIGGGALYFWAIYRKWKYFE